MTVTKLLSGIGLPHRNDLTVKRALRVDDNNHTALKQSKADGPHFTVVPPCIHEFECGAGKDPFGIEKIQPRASRVRMRLRESNRITGQEAPDEQRQGHRPAAQDPVVAAWLPPPGLDLDALQRRAAVLQPVAVLRIYSLLLPVERDGAALAALEAVQQLRRSGTVLQGRPESPGCTGGIAVMREIEVAHRQAWEADEGVNSAGGHVDP